MNALSVSAETKNHFAAARRKQRINFKVINRIDAMELFFCGRVLPARHSGSAKQLLWFESSGGLNRSGRSSVKVERCNHCDWHRPFRKTAVKKITLCQKLSKDSSRSLFC